MGGASSAPRKKTHAQVQRELWKKEQQAKLKEEKHAEKAERDEWIRNWKAQGIGKKWWNSTWWSVYAWWKGKSAWERERAKREWSGGRGVDLNAFKPHQE